MSRHGEYMACGAWAGIYSSLQPFAKLSDIFLSVTAMGGCLDEKTASPLPASPQSKKNAKNAQKAYMLLSAWRLEAKSGTNFASSAQNATCN
jgi:hypothetical protein